MLPSDSEGGRAGTERFWYKLGEVRGECRWRVGERARAHLDRMAAAAARIFDGASRALAQFAACGIASAAKDLSVEGLRRFFGPTVDTFLAPEAGGKKEKNWECGGVQNWREGFARWKRLVFTKSKFHELARNAHFSQSAPMLQMRGSRTTRGDLSIGGLR